MIPFFHRHVHPISKDPEKTAGSLMAFNGTSDHTHRCVGLRACNFYAHAISTWKRTCPSFFAKHHNDVLGSWPFELFRMGFFSGSLWRTKPAWTWSSVRTRSSSNYLPWLHACAWTHPHPTFPSPCRKLEFGSLGARWWDSRWACEWRCCDTFLFFPIASHL